ncbi:type I-D CRISPR-associated protein Cas7/Csc2 [Saccharolobus sp.]|uniref:type I-D CRISPR-associated protein Cas7/Csc2 n=1 Tax=Saccharolobus sp. TaxID=2100761 RepID=UPI00317F1DEB
MSQVNDPIAQFLRENNKYLRNSDEADRLFSKGRKIEVVYAVVSKGIPLFRTEGVGDVNVLDINIGGKVISVPTILPEKMQAKLRRRMLEILRNNNPDNNTLTKYEQLGFIKITDNNGIKSWNCYVAPPGSEGGTDIGLCGYCPSCNILGSIITRNELKTAGTAYGLKSRVVHDPAFGTTTYKDAVVELTHNKVGDGVSYTGMSLFQESHVVPGVVFIGKLVIYDATELETKLVLSSLSSISRMGGGETKYGSVQVIILGLNASDRETVSSYDITRYVIQKTEGKLVSPEDVIKLSVEYLKNIKSFKILADPNKKIDEQNIQININNNEITTLWAKDNYNYSIAIVNYIKKVEGKEKKGSQKK